MIGVLSPMYVPLEETKLTYAEEDGFRNGGAP